MDLNYWTQTTKSQPKYGHGPKSSAVRQRNVAQQRRKMETEEFQKLGAVLPISRAISEQHIDKTTIVRLASSYIKLHHLLGFDYGHYGVEDSFVGSLIDIIDGFLMVLTDYGEILYVSETISLHLGLSQVEMIGNLFCNYLHVQDSVDFQRFLKTSLYSFDVDSTTFRIKSTLTKRTPRDQQNPNAGYKPIQITLSACSQFGQHSRYVVGYCQPHSGILGTNLRLYNDTFIVTTDMALIITYIDPHLTMIFERNNLSNLQKYREFYGGVNWTKGASFYMLISPDDVHFFQQMHQKLFRCVSAKSPFIKLIANDGSTLFTVDIFGLAYSPKNHGNVHRSIQNDHFVFICTFVG